MKDWRDCKELPRRKEKVTIEGKTYLLTKYDFDYCLRCPVGKCKGKILIRAERRVLGALR